MKKTLIALAALGMMGSVAQASSVTVYGTIQPSIDIMTVDNGATDDTITTMQSNASRIGFKGSEDLGNGLKAVFKIETQFNAVEGNFDGGRDTYVGLKGDFGTVVFGKKDTAYKSSTGKMDSFSFTIGDYNAIMGMVNGGDDVDANNRDNRTINYMSPNFNGFKVNANYTLNDSDDTLPAGDLDGVGEGVTQATTTASYSLATSYNNGPLMVVAAYEKQKNTGEFWKIGASYKIDAATVKAIYEKAEADGGSDNKNFLIGVDYKLNGNTTLMADYIVAGDYASNDSGADMLNVGVKYTLSKRTSIMGVYSVLDNETNGLYRNDAGYGDVTGSDKVSGFSVRLQHKF